MWREIYVAAEMCGMLFSVWKLFSILLVTLGVEFRRPLSLSLLFSVWAWLSGFPNKALVTLVSGLGREHSTKTR